MKFRQILALLMAAALSNPSLADEIVLKNGSRIIGTLVSAEDSGIIFDTPFAGKITVAGENIERITTSESVNLKLKDNTILRDQQLITTEDGTVASGPDGTREKFDPDEIAFVNPEPWRMGEGYRWFGDINFAMQLERGNTDTDEIDSDLESIWRSLRDRYTIRGAYELDKANGDKNKNQWRIRNKYDRFRVESPDDYYGVQIAFAYDEFADLDLRTTFGPYIGRQFFQSHYLTLSGEIGIVYVDEQFDVAEDNDFFGSNWEFRASSGIIPGIELYADQTGVLNFDAADELLVDTRAGFSFPTLWGIKASVEALWEYDGGAVEGVDDMDETYNFKIGYQW